MIDQPLTREEIISCIEGKGAARRVPVMLHFWVNPDTFGERKQEAVDILGNYPMDVQVARVRQPAVFEAPEDDPDYRWVNRDSPGEQANVGIDERSAIKDWGELDDILARFPDPHYAGMFPSKPERDGRYMLGLWWFCFFERHWTLRGMANALMDYHTDQESVHRLFRALTDFYLVMIERAHNELSCDGMFTSDDIGMQTGGFFSPRIFREFFKPYYKELIDKAHSLGMHFWLHTCGNIEEFLPDFVEIGLDVVHPIQKYTMDEQDIAQRFGSDICIWAGFDVQQVIPWGTPEDVRAEVRFMMDTYFRPDGRFMITAGNGITSDCTVESLHALLDETIVYGKQIAESKSRL